MKKWWEKQAHITNAYIDNSLLKGISWRCVHAYQENFSRPLFSPWPSFLQKCNDEKIGVLVYLPWCKCYFRPNIVARDAFDVVSDPWSWNFRWIRARDSILSEIGNTSTHFSWLIPAFVFTKSNLENAGMNSVKSPLVLFTWRNELLSINIRHGFSLSSSSYHLRPVLQSTRYRRHVRCHSASTLNSVFLWRNLSLFLVFHTFTYTFRLAFPKRSKNFSPTMR